MQKFYEERNVFNMFARPQGHTQHVLVNSSECKHYISLQENSTGYLEGLKKYSLHMFKMLSLIDSCIVS